MAVRVALIFSLMVIAVFAQLPKIDFDVLLNNKQYVESQLKCVKKTDSLSCDKVGTRLRDVLLPDVAKTGSCTVCVDDTERLFLGKAGRLLKTSYPQDWAALMDIYKVAPEIRDKVLVKEMALIV